MGERLYTDDSLVAGKSGYGAVLLDAEDDVKADLTGSMGEGVTVFQAKCKAIIEGLTLLGPTIPVKLTVRVDNQAVVMALGNPVTETKLIKMTKEALNEAAKNRAIEVKWMKAHVCH